MEGYQDYKFMVQIDGSANSWGLVRKLRLGCCILSVESDWRSFHDKSLHPWVHYVPVKNDLADLNEKIEWCLTNQGQAKEIAERGRSFALSINYDEEMRDTVRSIYSHAQQHKVGPDGDGERRVPDGSTIRDGLALNRAMTVFSVDDFGTLTTAGDLAVGGRIASPNIAGSMTVTTSTGQGPTSGLAVHASAGFGINIFRRLGAGHYNPIVGTDDAALVFGLRDEINAHHLTIAAHSSTPGGIRLDNTAAVRLSGTVIISLDSLPTSDPHVAGQLWRSGTALHVSLGKGQTFWVRLCGFAQD
jgi:hypothetical protein